VSAARCAEASAPQSTPWAGCASSSSSDLRMGDRARLHMAPTARNPSAVTRGTASGCAGRHSVIAGERNDSRARPAKESTMTAKTQNAESRPLDDHELDLIGGGFVLIEELVTINQIAIIMGMQVPAPQVVRKP